MAARESFSTLLVRALVAGLAAPMQDSLAPPQLSHI